MECRLMCKGHLPPPHQTIWPFLLVCLLVCICFPFYFIVSCKFWKLGHRLFVPVIKLPQKTFRMRDKTWPPTILTSHTTCTTVQSPPKTYPLPSGFTNLRFHIVCSCLKFWFVKYWMCISQWLHTKCKILHFYF